MLASCDYSAIYRVPEELSEEMAEFALFTIDMGDFLDENHEPLLPHLEGKDLWKLKKSTKAQKKMLVEKEKADFLKEEEEKRLANLANYISQGYAFESPTEEVDCND
jgi:hypothetical protein